jgi:hypothetical protein
MALLTSYHLKGILAWHPSTVDTLLSCMALVIIMHCTVQHILPPYKTKNKAPAVFRACKSTGNIAVGTANVKFSGPLLLALSSLSNLGLRKMLGSGVVKKSKIAFHFGKFFFHSKVSTRTPPTCETKAFSQIF